MTGNKRIEQEDIKINARRRFQYCSGVFYFEPFSFTSISTTQGDA